MGSIPRIVEPSEASQFFSYSTFILSIPHIPTEGLVVFPGMGEDVRVVHAIDRWKKGKFKNFLIAGLDRAENTARKFTLPQLFDQPFSLPVARSRQVWTQVAAQNTAEQATWTAKKVKELNIRSLSITTSPFHLPRAYMTLLKAFVREVNWTVALIPDPTPVSPYDRVPESHVPAVDLIPGECERIKQYQEKGDLVSRQYLALYLRWLYDHIG